MSRRCPHCGQEYDVTLFAFGREVTCVCGAKLDAKTPQKGRPPEKKTSGYQGLLTQLRKEERERMREIAREADRISSLILKPDYPDIDIEIARSNLRQKVEALYEDRMDWYEMLYESRFRRLASQFRGKEE